MVRKLLAIFNLGELSPNKDMNYHESDYEDGDDDGDDEGEHED